MAKKVVPVLDHTRMARFLLSSISVGYNNNSFRGVERIN
jgi:hypothetical protein